MDYITYKYKLYSRCDRNVYLHRDIDAFAEVYNHFIAFHKRFYGLYGKYPSKGKLERHLTKLKKTVRFSHWCSLPFQALQNVIERIDDGYQLFFEKHNRRTPTFRSRFRYQSYTLKQTGYKFLEGNKIQIGFGIRGKTKRIFRYHKSRNFDVDSVKTVTVIRDRVGDLWLCIVAKVLSFKQSIAKAGKTAKTGTGFKQLDMWEKTSKTCSACDTVKDNLELRERTFRCECGHVRNRDHNAAINIHRWGRPPPAEAA